MRIKGSVKQLLDLWEVQAERPEHKVAIEKRIPTAVNDVREAVLHHAFAALTDINPDLDYVSIYYTDDPTQLVVKFGKHTPQEREQFLSLGWERHNDVL